MGLTTSLPYGIEFALALVLMAVPVTAQTGLSAVHGTVRDTSTAVVPNAKVTLTATATGVVRNTETNAAGIYHFGSVAIGPYMLAVEAPRFKKWAGTLTAPATYTRRKPHSLVCHAKNRGNSRYC